MPGRWFESRWGGGGAGMMSGGIEVSPLGRCLAA